ncbi:hydantoinase B/oxoprolinase family protein [Bacillus licheniformis]|nr:hydantoinase B/oxoprolinase family protein [Bacillus licheniformis]
MVANNRLSHWLEGDLNAMIGACKVAASRIQTMLDKYGAEKVITAIDNRIQYTETGFAMKSAAGRTAPMSVKHSLITTFKATAILRFAQR